MTKKELKQLMEEPMCIGYTYDHQGIQSKFYFQNTPHHMVQFIGARMFESPKIILTDMMDRLILTAECGFIMSCPNQKLLPELLPNLMPIQMGGEEAEDIPVASEEEMERLWEEEEEAVMEAEIKML